MKASVSKSEIAGKVVAPPSKSYTIRGLMCAALAGGESEIIQPLSSDDTEASVDVLSKVGISIHHKGGNWQVIGGNFHEPETDLYCAESAATLRFMTAICSIIPGRCRLITAPSLARRPVAPLIEAISQLGVDCHYDDKEAAVVVNGGRLRGSTVELPGNISSQFVSALLFIAPLAEEGMRIKLTTPLESRPYVLMTVDCLEGFGVKVNFPENLDEFEILKQAYQPTSYRVEGDWSSASYLLALGVLAGEAEVDNLNPESLQADRAIRDILRDMGAKVDVKKNSIKIRKSRLKAVKADLSDCIDLLPTVAVLAAAAEGISEFTGIERARLKESDRVSAVREGLEEMGIKVTEDRDRFTIAGAELRGSVINSHNDHRIAMAFSLLGAITGSTVIDGAECVSKTYPGFWDTLKSLGVKVKIDGK